MEGIKRITAWYFGGRMPFVARSIYPLELRAWATFSVGLGAVEGGVVGVLVKNVFAGSVNDILLNQAVAIVAGAPAFANILSFLWARYGRGKDKVSVLRIFMLLSAISLASISLAPVNGIGLVMFVLGVLGTRLFWAGIVTVRSAVWRSNYSRNIRGSFTARITVAASLIMAAIGVLAGWVLDHNMAAFRYIYPGAALAMLCGRYFYGRVRVRKQRALLLAETASEGPTGGRRGMLSILRDDRDYRRYMICMFVFGSGNLMVLSQMIIVVTELFDISRVQQMLITSSIPFLAMPLTLPLWARWFDTVGIVHYRSVQSWTFVAAIVVLALGSIQQQLPLVYVGAVIIGAGLAGGNLGWALGHNDFASDDRATEYMGLHLTLTGIRGFVAPVTGIAFYQFLQGFRPDLAAYSLLLPLLLTTSGALGFVAMRRELERRRQGA